LFSLFQEWRAEKAMEPLKGWMLEYAKVIREGELKKILVRDLVRSIDSYGALIKEIPSLMGVGFLGAGLARTKLKKQETARAKYQKV